MTGTAGIAGPAERAAPPTEALRIRDLHCGYGRTQVLRGVDLTVRAGSVVALVGPNGAGKTTLLKAVAGAIKPSRGTLHIGGRDVTRDPAHRRARLGLVHIPEGRGIFRSLTVEENLSLQAIGSARAALEKATAAFPILGNRLSQVAGSLSGGQQQMLALAAAYVRDPTLIVVDEASLGLAPVAVNDVFEFISRRAAEGTSILIVDQYVDRALALASRAYLMRKGEIRFSGSAEELAATDIFAEYVGRQGSVSLPQKGEHHV